MSTPALPADVSVADAAQRAAIKTSVESFDQSQAEAFRRGADIGALTRERTRFVDQLLRQRFAAIAWPAELKPQLALLAVGGYGRGELSPHSDIDLMLLVGVAGETPDELVEPIRTFIQSLFALGLDIGYSVRTLAQCIAEASADVTVMTSLMEARTLVGNEQLRRSMRQATAPTEIWPSAAFHRAKMAEMAARHRRFDHIDYNLEPNVKNSPGGLRDLHTMRWVAQRHFGTSKLSHLETLGFMTRDEQRQLTTAHRFLSRVRFGLHVLARRHEDRLLFEYQPQLAVIFGYEDQHEQLAVEQFMHDYYRYVLEMQSLSDVLLQHFDEEILRDHDAETTQPLNERFRIQGGYLEAVHPMVFKQQPSALLEIFVILAYRPELRGVRAATIRMIREDAALIDEAFRASRANRALFIQLMRSPHELVTQLTRMRRYGVLGCYLPEFGRIIGQMQHDLFHIYTVDAHTLQVIRNMRRFVNRHYEKDFPVVCECVRTLPRLELLYIAGLYHDIAKGRGGDHSTLGADDVRAFGERHELDAEDTDLLEFLVRDHLLMSHIAQRQDISDPDVIRAFAERVKTGDRLNYLFALTVADITATNPTLWNSWRSTLLHQLYAQTRNVVSLGQALPDKQDSIRKTLDDAARALAPRGITQRDAQVIWNELEDDYFLQHTSADIAWHTESIVKHDLRKGPLVLVRDLGVSEGGATEILLYTRNQPNLFAASAAALDQLNLSIQDARIYTSKGDFAVNTYIVLDSEGMPLGNYENQMRHLTRTLVAELKDPDAFPAMVNRRVPRQLRHFQNPTKVSIEYESGDPYSVLRVEATDRPGLLARLGHIFMELRLTVHGARIATLGERIEDQFYVSDENGPALLEPLAQNLSQTICQRLDEEL